MKKATKFFKSKDPCKTCSGLIRYVTSRRCKHCAQMSWKRRAATLIRRHPTEIIKQRIIAMNDVGLNPEEIADALTTAGYKNKFDNPYTVTAVRDVIRASGHKVKNPIIYVPKGREIVRLVKTDKMREAWFDFRPDNLELMQWQ